MIKLIEQWPVIMLIKKIELETANLNAVESFYSGILKFKIAEKTGSSICFSIGASRLQFHYKKSSEAYYHFAFLVPKGQLQYAFDWLKERHAPLHYSNNQYIADFANWNAHAFYFHDPQKNILEFIEHHDLENGNQEKFSADSVIGICEIGLAVDYVREECEDLHEELDIPYYKKGPLLDDFAVMGDEQGLLILSKIGRGWIPTGQASARYPLTVHLIVDGKEEQLVYS